MAKQHRTSGGRVDCDCDCVSYLAERAGIYSAAVAFLEHPLGKLATAVVLLVAIAPIVIWFFRDTWAALDADAARMRQEQGAGRRDYRTPLALVLCTLSLTLINYYGDHDTFVELVRPALDRWQKGGASFI